MSTLCVLKYPNPKLRLKASEVKDFDEKLSALADAMLETMYVEEGIGLAATQVDIQKSLLVVDISKKRNQPLCLVNPQIVEAEGEEIMQEGCLSVPGIYAEVKRAERVRVTALTPQKEPLDITADGLLAVCIQHEIDHLQGKLFVDYLSPIKRQRVLEQLKRPATGKPSEGRTRVPYHLV